MKLLGGGIIVSIVAAGFLYFVHTVREDERRKLQLALQQQRQEMSQRIDEAVQQEQARQYSLQQKLKTQEDKLNASIDSAGDCGTVPDVQLYLQSIGSPTGPSTDPRSP